jgi:FtsH-binding integral membrane protein
MPTYEQLGFGQGAALTGDRARAVFGQVMGLVGFSLVFTAVGAYVMRNAHGQAGIFFFLGAFACIFGLQAASARGREQLAIGLLFLLALLLGMAISPIIVYYLNTNPGVVYQAAGSTALFVGALGAFGYSTQRNLNWLYKWTLIGFGVFFVFGLITLFVAVPSSNLIYCVGMLVVFGGFTVIDFNRLKNAGQYTSAVPIAAGIYLDILNVFLLLLSLFGGGSRR